MKSLVVIFMVLISVAVAEAQQDKVIHFGASGFVSLIADKILFELYPEIHPVARGGLAAGIGLIPGILKEVTDPEFEMGDLTANIVGAVVGAVIGEVTNNRVSFSYTHKKPGLVVHLVQW